MKETNLLPGQFARVAGITQETLRYYERRGLLPKPVRGPNGYRMYAQSAANVVTFIKRAQQLGFTLREIRDFVALAGNPRAKCTSVCSAIEFKLAELDAQAREIQSRKKKLRELLNSCPGDVPIQECPIVETLAQRGRSGRLTEQKR
ncbi:MAG TPA: heavy metal-responsive transcriptional regulator [Candidatus Eisenbacteria bacterium]|jgi:DNA-binding transcriptional MerR regulator